MTNPTCLDVNECEAGLDDCAVKNATCVNSIGTFSCECAEGYGKYAPDYKDCKGAKLSVSCYPLFFVALV